MFGSHSGTVIHKKAPTLVQLERLVQFFEDNTSVNDISDRSGAALRRKRMKWKEITSILNALDGPTKDTKAWMKYWSDKKCSLNRVMSQWEASGLGTEEPGITDIDKQFINIMKESSMAACEGCSDPKCILQVCEDPLSLDERQAPDVMNIQGLELCHHLKAIASKGNHQQTPPARVTSAHPGPWRSQRLRARRMPLNRRRTDLERLIALEEKRVRTESVNSAGWAKAIQAINNLANAILTASDRISEALKKR